MLKSLALSAGLVAGAHAFWRMECRGLAGLARLDPLMSPNKPSGHVHAIHGSSGFSATSGSKELMEGDCTSCRVTQDKSAYWVPALYFEDTTTGKVEAVSQIGGMLAYYLHYGEKVVAFPEGFSMISGSSNRRTYSVGDPNKPDPPKSDWESLGQTSQDDLAERATGFNCLNYAKPPEGTLQRHVLPDKQFIDEKCTDGVRFELMFPSCWNGVDLDSKDHKSHVAFPDLVMTGNCLPSHPVRLPSLLYEVIWDTPAFKDRTGRFVLANGDLTGFGYHGDFTTGWDSKFLQKALDTCTNPSGRIEDCPLFDVVDDSVATSCKIKKSLLQEFTTEDILGPMDKLPGGIVPGEMPSAPNPGQDKPAAAPSATHTPAAAPSTTHTPAAAPPAAPPAAHPPPAEKPKPTSPALPGQAFKEHGEAAAPTPAKPSVVVQSVKAQPTPPPPPPFVPGKNGTSTQLYTDGNVVHEIIWEEEWVTVYEHCSSTRPPACTTAAAAEHHHRRHAGRHGHGLGGR